MKDFNEILFKKIIKKGKIEDSLKENYIDMKINKYSTTDKSNDASQLKLNDDENIENNFQIKIKKLINKNYEKKKINQQKYFYQKNNLINNFIIPNYNMNSQK